MPVTPILFENDVKMYGTQTCSGCYRSIVVFENDVKMYGTQTKQNAHELYAVFENDVKMYGTQTLLPCSQPYLRLRMM
ncbi:hypothetical protein RUMLAC_00173 [[Ruminococcus] lactaris ATCC 29176]|uniref:Uncharacterized protein n=1 Tax=[Ruminococcus] lactaris ATCC 29176 TaxID=471875 RepID=B5CL54_9FIRM|nr:hypothetical protein RUMLAC_00173 [[Ruminococcus] lactaris ATCC 29176]